MSIDSQNDTSVKKIFLKRDQILYLQGDASKFLYIVHSGRVALMKEADGRLFPLMIAGAKDFLGGMALFNDSHKEDSTAVVLTESEVLKVHKKDIQKTIDICPGWINEIMKVMAERLQAADQIIIEHKIKDDNLCEGYEFTQQEEVRIKRLIESSRSRKGGPAGQ